MKSRTSAIPIGSSPFVGSSKINNSGSCNIAFAIPNVVSYQESILQMSFCLYRADLQLLMRV